MATTRLMTAEDLEALSEPEDLLGGQYELIEGVLRRRPVVGGRHGALGARAIIRIGTFVEQHDLGEIFNAETIYIFQRGPDTALKPDMTFVRKERLPVERWEQPLELVPDLIVEVVSPGDRVSEVMEKVERYQGFGVPLLWVLWPDRRTIDIHAFGQAPRELGEGELLNGGGVLPGFSVAVADLFAVGRR